MADIELQVILLPGVACEHYHDTVLTVSGVTSGLYAAKRAAEALGQSPNQYWCLATLKDKGLPTAELVPIDEGEPVSELKTDLVYLFRGKE